MSNKRELAERLELAKQFAPKGPLSDEEIIASVHAHLPNHHPFPRPAFGDINVSYNNGRRRRVAGLLHSVYL
jgi:hypothetical protein